MGPGAPDPHLRVRGAGQRPPTASEGSARGSHPLALRRRRLGRRGCAQGHPSLLRTPHRTQACSLGVAQTQGPGVPSHPRPGSAHSSAGLALSRSPRLTSERWVGRGRQVGQDGVPAGGAELAVARAAGNLTQVEGGLRGGEGRGRERGGLGEEAGVEGGSVGPVDPGGSIQWCSIREAPPGSACALRSACRARWGSEGTAWGGRAA